MVCKEHEESGQDMPPPPNLILWEWERDHRQLTDPQGTGVSVKADGGVNEDAEMCPVGWDLQTVVQ